MQFLVKLAISIAIIIVCTQIARKAPSLAGLIATMPLTGLIVFIWLYHEHCQQSESQQKLLDYAKGAAWGVLPSIIFFLVAFFCLKKQLSFPVAVSTGFGAWLVGAFVHQWLLR